MYLLQKGVLEYDDVGTRVPRECQLVCCYVIGLLVATRSFGVSTLRVVGSPTHDLPHPPPSPPPPLEPILTSTARILAHHRI